LNVDDRASATPLFFLDSLRKKLGRLLKFGIS